MDVNPAPTELPPFEPSAPDGSRKEGGASQVLGAFVDVCTRACARVRLYTTPLDETFFHLASWSIRAHTRTHTHTLRGRL